MAKTKSRDAFCESSADLEGVQGSSQSTHRHTHSPLFSLTVILSPKHTHTQNCHFHTKKASTQGGERPGSEMGEMRRIRGGWSEKRGVKSAEHMR